MQPYGVCHPSGLLPEITYHRLWDLPCISLTHWTSHATTMYLLSSCRVVPFPFILPQVPLLVWTCYSHSLAQALRPLSYGINRFPLGYSLDASWFGLTSWYLLIGALFRYNPPYCEDYAGMSVVHWTVDLVPSVPASTTLLAEWSFGRC
eukprot:TRINITY_DN885_c0_g3_i4.p2 TRINITY_DN885_c0_g3~~TRINITY_DN885_c0_g3_i4.p2  ORF type:complete len:149 (+),score=1.69 TRINITY_DN885_c0_g3_i4:1112-1558(+)